MSKSRNLGAATAFATMIALPVLAEPLGIGRPALPEEIVAWSIAIMPDGRGLPPGRGNVLDGEDAWIENCAVCHGDFAEGAGNWPVIAGGIGTLTAERPVKTVGSYWPHLSTVWDYVNRSMPFGNAQTLTPDQVYALTAYILYSNGLVDDDFELSQDNFTEITLPNRDGFFPDDRDATEVPMFTLDPCMNNCSDPVQITKRATDLNVTPDFDVIRNVYSDGSAMVQPVAVQQDSAAALPIVPATATQGLDPALVAVGESAWRQCRACHQVGEGARNGTGPALTGIIGRTAGSMDGFRYSPAFVSAGSEGLVWTVETLDTFLTDPATLIPRNRMAFRGIADAGERAGLIAYLQSQGN